MRITSSLRTDTVDVDYVCYRFNLSKIYNHIWMINGKLWSLVVVCTFMGSCFFSTQYLTCIATYWNVICETQIRVLACLHHHFKPVGSYDTVTNLFADYNISLSSLCRLIWKHWTTKMLVRYMMPSVCLRLRQFSQLSLYSLYGAVCLQLTQFSCDDRENVYFILLSSSNRKYESLTIV